MLDRDCLIQERLSAQPNASIPHASESWSQCKATYRLWDNPKVNAEGILEAYKSSVRLELPR
ncbi:transposase DNA-binding-containing protein [Acaryochloris sp. IP29b_bin.148]|uniref:IS4/Tn5 family transposase DNA-binding protein n=1 Tax=Acaryochloris sp. IP29b_bin.148 TaxID=2969218 RepID=UPI0034533C86